MKAIRCLPVLAGAMVLVSCTATVPTKQEFEGDIAISYELTRIDDSDYGTTLLYIQAQGIGMPPYEHNICAWRQLREKPAMELYSRSDHA